MSGPICPDCGMFDIESFTDSKGKKKNRCDFCKWEGDELPRKALFPEQMRAYGREQRSMERLRKEGKLFFIRIHVKDPDIIVGNDDVWPDLMQQLQINHLDDPAHEPPYLFIKAKKKPTDEVLEYIKGIKGVVSVSVD